MARVLGVLRLSRDRDESTSVARQRGYIESWAEQNGHEIVGWAEDVDVSGSVPPWERPSLSQWLPDPTSSRPGAERQQEWDILAAWRLDRITRRIVHLWQVIEWARSNGKTIASTSEGFDLSTHMGRMVVGMLGGFAEGELEAIRERARSSTAHLIKTGRWRGGFVPYGYRPAPNADGHGWALEPDEGATADVLREVVRRVIDGQSVNTVVVWLNAKQQPTPLDAQRLRSGKQARGSEWRVGNLIKMLRSRTMLGYAEMTEEAQGRDGKTETVTRLVRDEDGMPLVRAEPLVPREQWDRLQAALDSRSQPSAATRGRTGGSLLLQVAFCECGEPLYTVKGRTQKYYRCGLKSRAGRSCGNRSMLASELEKQVVDSFLVFVGGLPIVRRTLVPGVDNRAALEDVEQALSELLDDRARGLFSSESGRRAFAAQLRKLEARETALRAEPVVQAQWVEEETGQTYAERWSGLTTDQERNKELRAAGVRVVLCKRPLLLSPLPDMEEALGEPIPPLEVGRVEFTIPPDLHARVVDHARLDAQANLSRALPGQAA